MGEVIIDTNDVIDDDTVNDDTVNDDKTVVVEGFGKATSVGELDVRKFIEVAMSLPSFWK